MQTLCINCDNNQSCLWKNDNVVQCNEHVIAKKTSKFELNEQNISIQKQDSLCNSCDFEITCTFKHKSLNTIYCEEYQ